MAGDDATYPERSPDGDSRRLRGRLERALRRSVRATTSPGTFFEGDDGSESSAVVIPVVLGFVGVAFLPVIVAVLRGLADRGFDVMDALPAIGYAAGESDLSVSGVVLLSAFAMLAFPTISWLAHALVFHLLSWPNAMSGSFRRTAVSTAWGFLPQIVASAVFVVAVTATFPASSEPLWSIGLTLPARAYAVPPDPTPVTLAGNTFGSLCTLWSGYVWVHALTTVRGVSRRFALVVVAVPLVPTLLITPPLVRLFISGPTALL